MDATTAKTVFQLTTSKETFRKKLNRHKKFLDFVVEQLDEIIEDMNNNKNFTNTDKNDVGKDDEQGFIANLIEKITDFNLEC